MKNLYSLVFIICFYDDNNVLNIGLFASKSTQKIIHCPLFSSRCHVCMHVHKCAFLCISVSIYIRTHFSQFRITGALPGPCPRMSCTHIYTYICVCVCMYVCMCVCMYICICMYVCIYAYMHVHMYTFLLLSKHRRPPLPS